MKKHTPAALKRITVLLILSLIVFIVGVFLALTRLSSTVTAVIVIAVGGILSVFLLILFFAERSRSLVIDSEKIVFPRTWDGKAVVYFSKIESVDRLRFKGDNVISKDCFLYRLRLRDGKTHDFYLYQYGKAAENEIFQLITSYAAAN